MPADAIHHRPSAGPDGAPPDESIDLGSSGTTELRVHGVSGTPPEQSLHHPLLQQVAGDRRAGFFRRWYPGGHSADLRAGRRLEAYSWGGLTSGGATRALWLLLLPFMLANLAHWMLPAVPAGAGAGRVRAARASAALLRVFGLALTLTLVLSGAQVAIDVIGWQCGSDPRCVQASRVLGPFATGVMASPGRRIVLAAVVPLLLIILIGMLGRQTVRLSTPAPDLNVARAEDEPLARPAFWRGNPGMAALRTTHVAAALAALAALVAWPTTSLVATGAARVVGVAICIGSLVAFAAAALLVARETATGREADMQGMGRVSALGARWLRRLAIVLLLAAATYSAWDWSGPWTYAVRLPGLRATILVSFVATVVLLLILTVTVAVQRPWSQSTADGYRPAVRGLAAPTTAGLAFLVAGGFAAGLTFRVAEIFGTPVLSEETRLAALIARETAIADPTRSFDERLAAATGDAPLVIPPSFAWAGAAATVIAVVLAVMAVALVLRVRRGVGPVAEAVAVERSSDLAGRTSADRDVRKVARTIAIARLGDDLGRVVGRLVAVSGIVLLAGAIVYAAAQDSWRFVEEPPLSTITRIGTWLIGLFAAGSVALFYASYRNETMRRTVGILWDIGSFWPRAAHPLSPPSYGERAVPELTARAEHLADEGYVLLSGHSQGSVLVAATVLQLPDGTRARTSLLTHGSPVRRLYSRFFPAYFGASTVNAVRAAVGGRWRNLYRDTDPIGAWVLDGVTRPSAEVDRYLVDPTRLGGAIQGHSDYWSDAAYSTAAGEVGDRE